MAKKTFRTMMKKKKKDLLKRTQEAHDRKDDSGSSFGNVFDKDKLPEGIEFWRPKKGEHIIDIIPFEAGANHPNDPKGELSYVVDHWVHRGVGPMREQYICPSKNYKEPCPICEFIAKERLPEPEWRKTKADHRVAYLVWIHDEKQEEEEKGVQIFEVAHWFFEKNVDEIAKKKRGGGYVVFSDMDKGKSIGFTIKSEGQYTDANGDKQESIGYTGFAFEDRDEPIPDEILDQSFCLDDVMLTTPTYEEIDEAFNGKKKEGKPDEADDTNESGGTSDDDATGGGDTGDEDTSEDDDTGDDDNDTGGGDTSDEDNDAGDNDTECPGDGTFGADIDKLDHCENCDEWDNCSDEADKLAAGE